MIKIKTQYEELKNKIIEMQNINNKLTENKKLVEDKNAMLKFQINSMKSQIRERENEIENNKRELDDLENYKYEKEKYHKTLNQTIKTSQNLKDDIDRKTRHIKELEKVIIDMNTKFDSIELHKEKSLKEVSVGSMKEKDKIIKYLENENNKLRADLEKERYKVSDLEYENHSLKDNANDNNEVESLKKQIDLLKKNDGEWRGIIFIT
jgi:chromosome segregation ATPase